MARKHNAKHDRSTSRYPQRLIARGESSSSVRMKFYEAIGKDPRHPDRVLVHDTPAFIHGRRG